MKFGPVFHNFRTKLLTNKLEEEARIKYANLYSNTFCGVILCYLLCYAILTRKEQHSFFYLPNLIQDAFLVQLQLWWYFVLFCDVMQQALPAQVFERLPECILWSVRFFITPWNLVVPKLTPQDQILLQLQLWWYFLVFCDVMQQALPASENLPGLSLVHRNKNGSLVSFRWKSVRTKYLNWAMIITSKSKRTGRSN